jgi:hypothetical protein
MNFETTVFENYFTSEEIDYISSECSTNIHPTSSTNSGDYYPVSAQVEKFINERITKFPNEVFFINLFDSKLPCGPHADINPSTNSNTLDADVLARTIIIPLDTYDSGTSVFHQQLEYNQTTADILNFPLLNQYEMLPNLFQHLDLKHLQRLALEEIFYWKKGSMLSFDRKKVHCSTMFPEGMTNKKALVIWTQLQK